MSYKIIHNSDGKTLYMKVAQNDETNLDTQPVRPPHISNISNLQHFTSGSSVQKCETPGILSRMFPPLAGITYYRVRSHLAPLIVMSCIVMLMFALYLLFLPPLLSGRLRDRHCCCPVRLRSRRPLLLARATRQAPPPLDHQISPILLYTACIRFCYCYCLLLF